MLASFHSQHVSCPETVLLKLYFVLSKAWYFLCLHS